MAPAASESIGSSCRLFFVELSRKYQSVTRRRSLCFSVARTSMRSCIGVCLSGRRRPARSRADIIAAVTRSSKTLNETTYAARKSSRFRYSLITWNARRKLCCLSVCVSVGRLPGFVGFELILSMVTELVFKPVHPVCLPVSAPLHNQRFRRQPATRPTAAEYKSGVHPFP